ncbi:MAG: glycosyltransferase, partial [Patescibacteria group bacterium]
MKIFLLTSAVPFRFHGTPGVTALHVVTRALFEELRSRGHTLVLQLLFDQSRKALELNEAEAAELRQLRESGVDVLPPLFVADRLTRDVQRFRTLRLFFNPKYAIEYFYPGSLLRKEVSSHIQAAAPDVILPLWCTQGVAATHGLKTVPRVAYHGDIDYEPSWARSVKDYALFHTGQRRGTSAVVRRLDSIMRSALFRRAHLRLMQGVDAIANITARNSDFYRAHGHARSFYVGNTWVDSGAPVAMERKSGPIKIIGHVGYLDRTGSTYGLRYLLRDVMPHLRRAMGDRPFEVHIIGGGEPFPEIESLLHQPNIIRHGFVADLEQELQSADLFCLLNNAGPLRAANTRHLVAWASGLCLVAHEGSREAIPELEHLQNAVLLSGPKEAGKLLVRAATDSALNTVLRRSGRETYERCFTPAIVGGKLERLLVEAVARRTSS